MFLSKKQTHVSFLTLLILFGISLVLAQARVGKFLAAKAPQLTQAEEGGFSANPEIFKLITFGHTPMAVDLLLISFLLDDRISHVAEGTRARAFYAIDLALAVDPRFFQLYFYGSNHLTVVRNDNLGAHRIVEKGTRFLESEIPKYSQEFRDEFWPSPWRLYLVKGYIELFEIFRHEEAAKSYALLSDYPGSPPLLQGLGKRMSTTPGLLEVAHRTLVFLHQHAKDPQQKAKLAERIKDVQVSFFIYDMNEKHRNKSDFPERDPWGGRLSRDLTSGKIVTTTQYRRIGKD